MNASAANHIHKLSVVNFAVFAREKLLTVDARPECLSAAECVADLGRPVPFDRPCLVDFVKNAFQFTERPTFAGNSSM